MAQGFITVGVQAMGEQVIARQFRLAEEWSHDLSEPLDQLMDDLIDSVSAQFDTEGAAAAGDPWTPLSDDYGAWKLEHYPGRPILVRDGAMREAMLDRSSAVHVTNDVAVYQPISRIAGYHQAGADWVGPAWGRGRYPHHLPQRKMVDLSESWKHEHVDRVFARWIARKLAEGRAAGVPLAA
jgi:Phage virion morphogenesis family